MKKIFENKKNLIFIVIVVAIVVFSRWDVFNFVKSMHPQKGDFILAGKMSEPRYNHEAILLDDGNVLILDSNIGYHPPDIYNPKTRKFRAIKNTGDTRQDYSVTKLNSGKILFTGGTSDNKNLQSTQIFNPEIEKFENGPDMNYPRAGHTATLLNDGRVLVIGGEYGLAKECEIYNPKLNKFQLASKLNYSINSHSAVLLNDGRVLIGGGVGFDGKFHKLASINIYDPKINKFESIGNMKFPRVSPNFYLLKNGNVLITGGVGNREGNDLWQREIEIYNPKTDQFRMVAKRSSIPNHPAEVLLLDDKILFTGGSTGVGLSLQNYKGSEIYDAETNTFNKGKDINIARACHRMTLLQEGNVLITGRCETGKIAELYISK